MTGPDGRLCPGCGSRTEAHELVSAQDWDGGLRVVCAEVACQICRQPVGADVPLAVIDRVLVCGRCVPLRVATVARLASARQVAGVELSVADRRAMHERRFGRV